MRIAELSSRSGTTVPTIKFYLREGLLPSGESTGRNQADYSEGHLHRLQLIRALMNVGGLSVAKAREVLSAVDTPNLPPHELLGAASYSLHRPTRRDTESPEWRRARQDVLALLHDRGWNVDEMAPPLDQAADAVAAFRALGQEDMLALLPTYAEAAAHIAAEEVDLVIARGTPDRMVEGVVTGTVIGEALLNALRRLAQADASGRRLVALASGAERTALAGQDSIG